jgi:hypothetical protein
MINISFTLHRWHLAILGVVIIGLLSADGCAPTADQQRAAEQQRSLQQAAAQVGMPAIQNFQEQRMVKDLYEKRDKAIVTYAYLQAIDGSLRCYGEGAGYPLPYSAQFTSPTIPGVNHDQQAEPNGLFMPDSAAATWYMMKNPADNKLYAVYTEPNMIASPFKLPCIPLDAQGR